MIVVIDSPHAGTYYGGTVAAPIFKRIADDALRHLGVPPSIDPLPAVLVARADATAAETPRLQPAVVEMPTDAVPDVAGLSARDAITTLARAGLRPRLTGDGFVVGQSPVAGAPLLKGADVRLVLGRLEARREPEVGPKP
jgi:cell division protein FtsI (penicillin-binding protein 3)